MENFNDGMNEVFYPNMALIFTACHLLGLHDIFCNKYSEVAQELEYANTSPTFMSFCTSFPGSLSCSYIPAWEERKNWFLRRPYIKKKHPSITEVDVESIAKHRHPTWLRQGDPQSSNQATLFFWAPLWMGCRHHYWVQLEWEGKTESGWSSKTIKVSSIA